tara:strand:+ start:3248 stop:3436 length:189 start_codon:yes stop_codon:yes gene_type:complete
MTSNGVERDKIKFINFTMNEIHDSLDELYESFVEGDYTEVKKEASFVIRTLTALQESVEDEI